MHYMHLMQLSNFLDFPQQSNINKDKILITGYNQIFRISNFYYEIEMLFYLNEILIQMIAKIILKIFAAY